MGQVERQQFHAREFRGYALDVAARLEASHPHLLLKVLHGSDLFRQIFFAASVEIDLDRPEQFLARVSDRAPDILTQINHLDPHAQIARALILLKPRRLVEVLYGSCPNGYLGLLDRVGSAPLYGAETYRAAFELFSNPRHRRRAAVLGQMAGMITPDHITMVSSLNDVLLHRAVLPRARPVQIEALNAFAEMLARLCDASPGQIRSSLDSLPAAREREKITGWAQSWAMRQVRLPVAPPIPGDDPDLRLRLGRDLVSLGRRLRNCAAQKIAEGFVADELIYEWTADGGQAVVELHRLTMDGKTAWVCNGIYGQRNRKPLPGVAAAIRAKLDEHGVLYRLDDAEKPMKLAVEGLLDPFGQWTLNDPADEAEPDEHAVVDVNQLLADLEQEVASQEAERWKLLLSKFSMPSSARPFVTPEA